MKQTMMNRLLLLLLVVSTIILSGTSSAVTQGARYMPDAFTELHPGDTGGAVSLLQMRLSDIGYYKGTIDGNYNDATESAVRAFQEVNRLTVDGIATQNVQFIMFNRGAIGASGASYDDYIIGSPSATEAPRKPKTTKAPKKPKVTEAPRIRYIGNCNTYKFHYPSCPSVSQMNDENKVGLYSREEAISWGYDPCKRCNP